MEDQDALETLELEIRGMTRRGLFPLDPSPVHVSQSDRLRLC